MFKFELGQKARNRVTGFEGTITTRQEHLTGCRTYWLQPKGLDDKGQPFESAVADEPVLELLDQAPAWAVALRDGAPAAG